MRSKVTHTELCKVGLGPHGCCATEFSSDLENVCGSKVIMVAGLLCIRSLVPLSGRSILVVKVMDSWTSCHESIKSRTNSPVASTSKDGVIRCPAYEEEYCDPPTEGGIQCRKCQEWWHEECSFQL
ncbi:hypothetical protein TNCV_4485901 [Trichonephila clavipes]|nr:hypothetical protein TNCV_4485901 [Trichonephila clavipes]